MQNYTVNGIEYNWKTGLPLNQTDQDIDDIRKEEELNQYQEVVKQNNINPSGSGLSNIPSGEGNAKINGVEINPDFGKVVTTEELKKHLETYTKEFVLYGSTLDLNFKEYMVMKGLSEDEFEKLILEI